MINPYDFKRIKENYRGKLERKVEVKKIGKKKKENNCETKKECTSGIKPKTKNKKEKECYFARLQLSVNHNSPMFLGYSGGLG